MRAQSLSDLPKIMAAASCFALLLVAFVACVASIGTERNFTQLIDHFSSSDATFQQRFYESEQYFGGAGNPIFVIMGGEGAIPAAVGLFYPFVYAVLAKEFKALVIEPEHRFYGTSLPFGEQSHDLGNLQLLNAQQALADAADLIIAIQAERKCTARGTPGYCPVVTVGGSAIVVHSFSKHQVLIRDFCLQ